ncbi:YqaJ-like recombinase protein [Mycolicibacterium mucogenicum 261Sha1.1M5]|nr:YqaJ-like recombinase protein [Mycolicibacterium mucogenicum 261Sha1.1M5]
MRALIAARTLFECLDGTPPAKPRASCENDSVLISASDSPTARSGAHLSRIVTDGSDRAAWMRARARGITATDVAKLSTPRSIETAAREKMYGSSFIGNAYTEHGKAREPEIAAWVEREHGIRPSSALFHAASDLRHLATPDGVVERETGALELAEIKTTNKEWRGIPRNYLRQIWWQQYVLGAERTLMVWERHENFVPVGDPECRWIERDESEIERLVKLASELIDVLIARTT